MPLNKYEQICSWEHQEPTKHQEDVWILKNPDDILVQNIKRLTGISSSSKLLTYFELLAQSKLESGMRGYF